MSIARGLVGYWRLDGNLTDPEAGIEPEAEPESPHDPLAKNF